LIASKRHKPDKISKASDKIPGPFSLMAFPLAAANMPT
jgi:hypothetical protein